MTPCTRSELILVLRLPASNEIIETVDEWAARCHESQYDSAHATLRSERPLLDTTSCKS